MIALLLLEKIVSLFLILLLGVILVRSKLLRSEDSQVISTISMYIIMPCQVITAFMVDASPEVLEGLLLALVTAIGIHVVLIALSFPITRIFKLNGVEEVSVLYSNGGALVIPLVVALFGPEWVIYTTPFICVQLFLIWTHGVSVLRGENRPDIKKIVTNPNIIAIAIALFFFFTGIRLPGFVEDAVDSLSAMLGTVAMLVAGMLLGSMDMKKALSYKRLPLICFLRLVVLPLIMLVLVKLFRLETLLPDGFTIVLISLLAAMTPTAAMVTMMTQIYGGDAEYASAIQVVTTLCCLITMPLMVFLYQSI